MCIAAIIGDQIGSRFEKRKNHEGENFKLFAADSCFTDDSILTIAICDAIMNGKSYADVYRRYYSTYTYGRYGKSFRAWAKNPKAENGTSWGNGACMRVSPIAYAFHDKETILEEAKKSAMPTHGSEEGIKGAQTIALAVFMARKGCTKDEIKEMVKGMGYDLDNIPVGFQIRCQETVPQAVHAFLESNGFEDAIRKAILMEGDSDTLAAITGSIAMPFYGEGLESVSKEIMENTFKRLPSDLAKVVVQFIQRHIDSKFERPCKMSIQAEFYDLWRMVFE